MENNCGEESPATVFLLCGMCWFTAVFPGFASSCYTLLACVGWRLLCVEKEFVGRGKIMLLLTLDNTVWQLRPLQPDARIAAVLSVKRSEFAWREYEISYFMRGDTFLNVIQQECSFLKWDSVLVIPHDLSCPAGSVRSDSVHSRLKCGGASFSHSIHYCNSMLVTEYLFQCCGGISNKM